MYAPDESIDASPGQTKRNESLLKRRKRRKLRSSFIKSSAPGLDGTSTISGKLFETPENETTFNESKDEEFLTAKSDVLHEVKLLAKGCKLLYTDNRDCKKNDYCQEHFVTASQILDMSNENVIIKDNAVESNEFFPGSECKGNAQEILISSSQIIDNKIYQEIFDDFDEMDNFSADDKQEPKFRENYSPPLFRIKRKKIKVYNGPKCKLKKSPERIALDSDSSDSYSIKSGKVVPLSTSAGAIEYKYESSQNITKNLLNLSSLLAPLHSLSFEDKKSSLELNMNKNGMSNQSNEFQNFDINAALEHDNIVSLNSTFKDLDILSNFNNVPGIFSNSNDYKNDSCSSMPQLNVLKNNSRQLISKNLKMTIEDFESTSTHADHTQPQENVCSNRQLRSKQKLNFDEIKSGETDYHQTNKITNLIQTNENISNENNANENSQATTQSNFTSFRKFLNKSVERHFKIYQKISQLSVDFTNNLSDEEFKGFDNNESRISFSDSDGDNNIINKRMECRKNSVDHYLQEDIEVFNNIDYEMLDNKLDLNIDNLSKNKSVGATQSLLDDSFLDFADCPNETDFSSTGGKKKQPCHIFKNSNKVKKIDKVSQNTEINLELNAVKKKSKETDGVDLLNTEFWPDDDIFRDIKTQQLMIWPDDDVFTDIKTQQLIERENSISLEKYPKANCTTRESGFKTPQHAPPRSKVTDLHTKNQTIRTPSCAGFKLSSGKNAEVSENVISAANKEICNEIQNIEPEDNSNKEIPEFVNFKFLSGKNVQYSLKAKQKADQFLSETDTMINAEIIHNGTLESSKVVKENENQKCVGFKLLSGKNIQCTKSSFERAKNLIFEVNKNLDNDIENSSQNGNSNNNSLKVTQYKNGKRKSEDEYSFPQKTFKLNEDSSREHSNNFVESNFETPLRTKRSVLSLSKLKTKNPIELQPTLAISTPVRRNSEMTPNLKEFFSSIENAEKSTPEAKKIANADTQEATPSFIQELNNENESSFFRDFVPLHESFLTEISGHTPKANQNVESISSQNTGETPKRSLQIKRIDKLKMYPDAPPISPNAYKSKFSTNKCKRPGLSRILTSIQK